MPDTTSDDGDDSDGTPLVDEVLPQRNTLKHWALYALDAFEAESAESSTEGANPAREYGVDPVDLYEFVGGDDSRVFRSAGEVHDNLNKLRTEYLALDRRTEATDFAGPDTDYRFRLNDRGREVLLEAGRPQRLPRRHDDAHDRELESLPGHRPGWWLETPPWEREWQTHDQGVDPDTTQHRVLAAVARLEPTTSREATDYLDASRGSVSATLNRLFERQLIERRELPDAGGRTAYEFRVTDRGADVLAELGDPDGLDDDPDGDTDTESDGGQWNTASGVGIEADE